MADMKAANEELYSRTVKEKIKFPSLLDESKRKQKCGQILLLHRTEDGFDVSAAFAEILSQFGVEDGAGVGSPNAPASKKGGKAKRKAEADAEEPGSPSKEPKAKKSETYVNEENRGVGSAILEIAGFYYKAGEGLKGGAFSKAAKALRETPAAPRTKKEAMTLKLPGVGKSTAEKIEEFYTTGKIQKLEEMRAQNM